MFEESDIAIKSILSKLTETEITILQKHFILTNNDNKVKKKSAFTKEEDNKLKRLVSQYGDKAWAKIALEMEGRTQRQCRERYKHYLSPNILNAKWTDDEDKLLLEKYKIYGPKWAIISKYFKMRTDINIKNRWIVLMRRNAFVKAFQPQTKESSNEEENEKQIPYKTNQNEVISFIKKEDEQNVFDEYQNEENIDSNINFDHFTD